jgi:hypothetical protein
MPLPAQSWTVSCPACNLVIGAVEGGRFVHDAACGRPLAIGTGLLRCCQCGGRLSGIAHRPAVVAAAAQFDEPTDDEYDEHVDAPPLPSILPFVRSRLPEEARHRL